MLGRVEVNYPNRTITMAIIREHFVETKVSLEEKKFESEMVVPTPEGMDAVFLGKLEIEDWQLSNGIARELCYIETRAHRTRRNQDDVVGHECCWGRLERFA